MRRKRLPKKYLQTLFRPILIGVEDWGDGMVRLKILKIGPESGTFRRKIVARSELAEHLEKHPYRVPEGAKESVAGVLLQEKLEAGEVTL